MTEKRPKQLDPKREEEIAAAVLKAATKYTGLVMARAIVKEYQKIMEVSAPDFGQQYSTRGAPITRTTK